MKLNQFVCAGAGVRERAHAPRDGRAAGDHVELQLIKNISLIKLITRNGLN